MEMLPVFLLGRTGGAQSHHVDADSVCLWESVSGAALLLLMTSQLLLALLRGWQ